MDKVIIIGSGMDNGSLEMIKTKFEKIGHEVIIVNSKEDALNLSGTTITNEDLIKAFEEAPSMSSKLSSKLYEEPKPFILKSYHSEPLNPIIREENHGPIGAIFRNNKKRRR